MYVRGVVKLLGTINSGGDLILRFGLHAIADKVNTGVIVMELNIDVETAVISDWPIARTRGSNPSSLVLSQQARPDDPIEGRGLVDWSPARFAKERTGLKSTAEIPKKMAHPK
jgi:hypothetical protein